MLLKEREREVKERELEKEGEGQWQRGRKVEYIKEMGNIKCNYEWDSGKEEKGKENERGRKRKVRQLSVYSSEDE